MRDFLAQMIADSGALSTQEIALHIIVSALFGGLIYLSYWFTHTGTAYSKKFNVSLVTLATLTGTVMTVIGDNIVLSLGMVGALSIVRFRTAIKDSRDTTYIFWAIVVGICCGVGDYLVAAIGSAVIFVLLIVLGRVRNENRILLIVRGERSKTAAIESLVFDYFDKRALLRVRNTTEQSVELIYEMPRKVWELNYTHETDVADSLYGLGGIEYVNTIAQSDEITG